MNLASIERQWPLGRGFERFYGFLGAETNQWYPDLVHDNHPVEQPAIARGGLPLHDRHHRPGAAVHPRRQGGRAGQAVLPVLRAGRLPRAAPRAQGVGRQVQGQVRHGLRGATASSCSSASRQLGHPARTAPSSRRSTRTPTRPAATASRGRSSTPSVRGTRSPTTSSGCSARMAEVYAGLRRPLRSRDRPAARLPRGDRAARQHDRRRRVRQRRIGRGRPERLGQRDQVLQRDPRHRSRRTSSYLDELGSPEDLQPLPDRAGRGRSTRRSRCASATPTTRAAPPIR